jgi:large subunit ribosomal protein L20
MSYSRLIAGLKKSGVAVNRKTLAELAVKDQAAFGRLLTLAKDSLGETAA